MTRIVAGTWGGRRLKVPATGTRPTSDRVREAVFNTLSHDLDDWSGIRVLDLFAGSGALGLEALSRGAASVTLVERDRTASAVIGANVRQLSGAQDRVTVWTMTSLAACRGHRGTPYDLVLADPPYEGGSDFAREALAALIGSGGLAPGATVVVELASGGHDPFPEGVVVRSSRRYGDTAVWYGHHGSPDPTEQE